jgi:hypothetical protein
MEVFAMSNSETSTKNIEILKNILIPKTEKKKDFYFSFVRKLPAAIFILFITGIIITVFTISIISFYIIS